MVSDSELVGRLHDILSTADLNTTTTATVRRKLEQDLGIDLSDKKSFIREQVDLFLQTHFEKSQQEEEQEDEQEEELKEEKEEELEEDAPEEEEQEEGSGDGKAKVTRRSKKQDTKVKRRGGGGGFTKVCSLSPQLQNFTGVSELPRTEVVKQLWSYIRENNLQDPSDRRTIICDDALRELFSVDSINMFQMNKSLAKHIWPLDSDASVNTTPKEKKRKQEPEEDSDKPNKKEKRHKGGNTGILAPIPLSDALVKFLGTGETALSRPEVLKRMWDYIKENNLQDPSDKRRIISDEKLKELFEVDTFVGFTVTKLLKSHFVKAEK